MHIFEVTLGPLLLGIFFNTYLYGLLTFQYASYYNTAFNDALWIRLIYLAWVYAVDDFVNPLALASTFLPNLSAVEVDPFCMSGPVWPYPAWVFVATVTACITQVFLAYRILRLKKSVALYATVLVLAAAAFIFGIIFGVKVCNVKTYAIVSQRLSLVFGADFIMTSMMETGGMSSLISVWLCLEVGVNVLITGILLHSLSQSRTGFQRSDSIINRLMQTTVQTGLLTSVVSVLTLVLYLADRDTEFYSLFGVPISRLYSNTLMHTLLCREELRGMIGLPGESTHITLTTDNIQLFVRKEIETDVHIDDSELAKASPSVVVWHSEHTMEEK
ncbi:uncharacterized protein LACBIDRAFT_304849 [Laccaria bicolor S238N-H82]|uniref:Predicted protein n=1 Tax=Laccaria bicolor (strain S238N-H82 / ATCC MYA-4686) TaxID=486041 RepID=B0DMF9_LACBS|nr:uncharacterized protein LACBIDRAFT_304838 [Laccaria bicolor S238N-H82]XP_001885175.1 uncharacterized protein LACBIDRAFT_304849 [Laccaria bicolor S238N-H82]EDR04279.1 predicted protein [Laccaria bicolor S238N-H82]EDR04284.1 predicted protein [Laccaria bicolor S238N-H82]|eukprot:XP_001885170.1 predicted protein [Laccaria bicolor S238N-H82]